MRVKLLVLLLVVGLMLPAVAGAVEEKEFVVDTTADLIALCTASKDDPRQKEAIHFCHGYLIGALDFHLATTGGPKAKRLVCFPEVKPTRDEGIAMFIDWVKAHPQYLGEEAVDTEFRFLMEKWPCKP